MASVAFSNPDGVAPPTGYSHAVLVTGEPRRLLLSGQVGKAPDGTIPEGGEDQITLALANIRTLLAAHGMLPSNIVKTTIFITDRSLLGALRSARDAFFEGHAPASTLLIVMGLADPKFVVEIEVEAVA